MASVVADNFRKRLCDGEVDFVNDDYLIMLCKAAYAPSTSDDVLSDGAIAAELSDATYLANGTSGRVTLANKSTTLASNRCECRADNVTYSALDNETVTHVVLYQDLGGADADNLFCIAFDIADVAETGLDLVIKWNAAASNGALFKT
jgi:hypothetical protein